MARYLIDTDVMIDVSRGSAAAATFVDSLEDITISIITATPPPSTASCGRSRSMPTWAVITRLAYDLLKRHAKADGLRTFDALIAATAVAEGFTLVSRNRKHFQNRKHFHRIGDLAFEVPSYLTAPPG